MPSYARAFLERHEKAVVHGLLIASTLLVVVLAILSVRGDSATSDEPAHIVNGVIKLRDGWFDFFNEQPPLMNTISALPVVLAGARLDPAWRNATSHWSAGSQFLYWSGNDADRLLFLARLPTIALFVGLCFVVFAWVRDATGSRWSGLLGFLLTAFDPNLLAHGRLATVDLAVSFFMTSAAWLALRALERPTRLRLASCGAAAGCAVLCKVSGLLILPWIAAVFLLAWLRERPLRWRALMQPTARLAIVFAAAILVFEVVYLAEIGDEYVARTYPGISAAGGVAIPFAEYAKSVRSIERWVNEAYDKPMFLLGEFSKTGWWYYYLAAYALKNSIATLVLVLFAIAVGIRQLPAGLRAGSGLSAPFHLVAALLFVVLMFAASTRSHVALGVRYVLPVMPFLAVAIPVAFGMTAPRMGRGVRIAIVALVLWSAGSTIAAHPSYLSYFNELVPASEADKYLIDSNLDWGQDLKRLVVWADQNDVRFIHMDYFGGGNPTYYFRERAARWLTPNRVPLPRGWFALSRQYYRTSFYTREFGLTNEEYFRDAKHVATIGGSIDVYWVE